MGTIPLGRPLISLILRSRAPSQSVVLVSLPLSRYGQLQKGANAFVSKSPSALLERQEALNAILEMSMAHAFMGYLQPAFALSSLTSACSRIKERSFQHFSDLSPFILINAL
jgi:hypothetical protein